MSIDARRPIKICLIGHSTRSHNLGVGALTVSQVEILQDITKRIGRKLEIVAIDWKDARMPYVTGKDIQVVDFDRSFFLNPRGFFATVRRSDIVIDIGAGDSFSDIYGSGRLFRMFGMKFLVHLARTPLVVAPQTIGPFHKRWSRFLARLTLQQSALVATRDPKSTAALRELGYTKPIVEASDVALRLPFTVPSSRTSNVPVRVGVNASGLLMVGGYRKSNDFGLVIDYPVLLRDLVRNFLARGAEVHLVPHVIVNEGRLRLEDDLRACESLAEEFPEARLAPAFESPSEAKSYIAGLDFFVGARMHACIAALSSGVAVVPMAYSRKFASLFDSLGYRHTVDCTCQDADQVKQHILSDFEQREVLAEEAKLATFHGRQLLRRYEDRLEAILRSSEGLSR